MNTSTARLVSDVLKSEFETRNSRNRKFSLRSFARFLEMPVSTLSTLMAGNTNPTVTTIKSIGKKLQWDSDLLTELQASAKSRKRAQGMILNARKEIKPFSDLLDSLVPLAVLALAKTDRIEANASQIAQQLDVARTEVVTALDRLIQFNLAYIEDGILKARRPVTAIIEDPDGPPLKRYISEWLKRGSKRFLDSKPIDSNGILFSIVATQDQLEELKIKFEAFARSVRKSFPESGSEGELYSVGAVVFPFKRT